jgi:hypothetical protein
MRGRDARHRQAHAEQQGKDPDAKDTPHDQPPVGGTRRRDRMAITIAAMATMSPITPTAVPTMSARSADWRASAAF